MWKSLMDYKTVFIRRSLSTEVIQIETRCFMWYTRTYLISLGSSLCLTGLKAAGQLSHEVVYFVHEVWYMLASAVQAAEARHWCSSWVLRYLDIWHINLEFPSIYSVYLSDECHASGSLCSHEALSCLHTHWTMKGTHLDQADTDDWLDRWAESELNVTTLFVLGCYYRFAEVFVPLCICRLCWPGMHT